MMAAVEAEGVTAVMLVGVTAPVAAVVMVSSKHVSDPISLYRNDRYIGLADRQELF
jgi:presenilin-like A22 family membrane protease